MEYAPVPLIADACARGNVDVVREIRCERWSPANDGRIGTRRLGTKREILFRTRAGEVALDAAPAI